ncbi:PREDICTED: furin-1-like [Amphimedon queenslandica]|uniref:P/Homo B domain-containing protein n=1 Tax=Amphimedon queenslandica TaxID=400682 RepID=A0A1X7UDL5_AMPQE|nr:PREDICTED: furin-1-like [Amphimedon queenslandica]|eukprot:XP_011405480.2 PREDICTED: furin-1-like [Amphimedon queenslandica]
MKQKLSLLLLVYLALFAGEGNAKGDDDDDDDDQDRYTNSWVVELASDQGHDAAEELAKTHGFTNMGQVGNLEGYYHFIDHESSTRTTRSLDTKHLNLMNDQQVVSAEQQVSQKRVKRSIVVPHDTMWSRQWYLNRESKNMNVMPVWDQGITGKGVVVTILDDGLEHTHPDLKANYDAEASYDFNANDHDPFPRYDVTNENRHGTRCAGEVAASLNNVCSVGVAYHAKIGGVRMLDGQVTDIVEAKSLSFGYEHIDIYSSSWGPNDDGKTVDGPAKLAKKAFLNGIAKGRNGKGSIFVWASGNGGSYSDSCNCDGYVLSPFTIAIGSITEYNNFPWYAERCSSIMAITYSSGSSNEKKIISTDLHGLCTDSHTGTSAAAPMAAGMIALALEIRPDLTWRDVQYIIVYSSSSAIDDDEWITNGAGLRVSSKYGYGLLDGAALVNRARHWVMVPERQNCTVHVKLTEEQQSQSSVIQIPIDITKESCPGVLYLEHVQAITSLSVNKGLRGNIAISLRSPSGTLSKLLPTRHLDRHSTGFDQWPFMSVMNWGESPMGRWVYTVTTVANAEFTMTDLTLVLYGVASKPVAVRNIPKKCSPECKSGCSKAGPQYCDTCLHKQVLSTLECVQTCPTGTYSKGQYCIDCPKYCTKCTDDSTCQECKLGAYKLPSGLCNSTCTDSTIFVNNSCQACHVSCMTCDGLGDDDCTSCHQPQYRLVNGQCVFHPNCSSGQYFEHRVLGCKSCHGSCLECSGRKESDCTSCSPSKVFREGSCIDKADFCSTGEYYSESTGSCAVCPPGCSSCINDLTCLKCDQHLYIYSALMEHSNLRRTFCIETCPDGYYGDIKSGNCTLCSSTCATCTDAPANCTTCVQSGVLPHNGSCPAPCSPHQFYNFALASCGDCPMNCSSCSNETYCTRCLSGFYLNARGECYPQCATGTVQNPLSGQCESTKCHSTCLTCVGPSKKECLSCSKDLIFFKNECWKACPVGFYRTSNRNEESVSCSSCHSNCRTCDGPTDGECLSCSHLKPYLDGYHCVQKCRSGYYVNMHKACLPCSSQCTHCTDGSTCSHCQGSYVVGPAGDCLSECPAQYHESNGLCVNNQRTIIQSTTTVEQPSAKSWTVFVVMVTCLLLLGVLSILILLVWKRRNLHLVLRRNKNNYVVLYPDNDEFEMNGQPGSESETEIFSRSEPM